MIYLDLFWGFLKVGLFSFGGAYAAIPLIREVVLSYGWLDDEMLSYMIAVSESTPGPIMINLATYVGTSQAGMLGALIASFTVTLPAFLIILLVTVVLAKVIDNKYFQSVLQGIIPCVIGIILATGGFMILKNMFGESFLSVDLYAVIITVLLFAIYWGFKKLKKKAISPIMLICISAVLGIIVYRL